MVYCTECGTDNEENAEYCVKCGASLYPEKGRERRPEKRYMCFGLPHGNAIFGIILGIIIILWGAREIFHWNIDFGPFIVIIIGVLIAGGAVYRMTTRRT